MSWSTEAVARLDKEYKAFQGNRYEAAMKKSVLDALKNFCTQDEEFAQAVVQGRSFADCMQTVAKNCGSSLPDIEAYRRAVQFYFDGAQVEFQMRVVLAPAAASEPSRGIVLNFEDFL